MHFIKVKKNTKPFERIKGYFSNYIVPVYGNQDPYLKKIEKGKDRVCELLQTNSMKDVGLVVYKTVLSNEFSQAHIYNALEIKTLFVINPAKNSGKGIATLVLEHVAKVAIGLNAHGIVMTVSSEKPESLIFALKRGFRIFKVQTNPVQTNIDEYFLFHSSPLELIEYKKQPSKFLVNDFYLHQDYTNKFLDHVFSWPQPHLANHYIVVCLNPLYENPQQQEPIGYILSGITPQGRSDFLRTVPLVNLSQKFWLETFLQIKAQGVEIINIFYFFPITNSFISIAQDVFPTAKAVKSKICKRWYPDSFSPLSTQQTLNFL